MAILDTLAFFSGLGLAMIWLGYPLGVALLGLVRRPGRRPANEIARAVSVVLASRDPLPRVVERVHDLAATSWAGPLEIIVAVPGAHVDEAGQLFAEPAPRVPIRVVSADSSGGKVAALNAAMRVATGDVIVFADTSQRFEAGTIPGLVDALHETGAAAVSGYLVLPPGTSPLMRGYWAFERWLREREARVHSTVGVTGAVYAMWREYWRDLPADLLLDDVYNPMRLVLDGRRIGFARAARAHETRTPTPDHEYARKVRTLTGVIQLCRWLPGVLLPWRNPIWLQFVFHKLLRMITPYLVLLLAAWVLVQIVSGLGRAALPAFIGAGLALLFLLRLRSDWARAIRRILREGVMLQVATMKAALNGVRGRWQVWNG